jgi:hypothetical protein
VTDLAHALAAKILSPFEGQDVTGAAMEVPGAAGGLREALAFAPIEFHIGDEVFMVFKCAVAKVRFVPQKDTDALTRVHIMEVLETALVDEHDVYELLANQRDRIKRLKEEAAGIQRLAYDDDLAGQEAAALAEEAEEGGTDAEGYFDPAAADEHPSGTTPIRKPRSKPRAK